MSRRGGRAGRTQSVRGFLTQAVVASGTTPPTVTLTGVPNDYYSFNIQITTGGTQTTSIFEWSSNGGATFTTGQTSAATFLMGSTGVTINFSAGSYTAGDQYLASVVPI